MSLPLLTILLYLACKTIFFCSYDVIYIPIKITYKQTNKNSSKKSLENRLLKIKIQLRFMVWNAKVLTPSIDQNEVTASILK